MEAAACALEPAPPLAWCPEPNPEELALPDEVDAGGAAASPPTLGARLLWGLPPRHLLVLDVNGLLIERSFTALRDAQNEPVEPDLRVGAFYVYNRPGLRAFVAMLMERFVVGVWSSARQHNLRGLVRHIFGAHEERLAFAWGQEACTYAGTSAKSKPLFLKDLSRVWQEPAFAAFGPHNTLLVDDDAYKAARNPPNTAIHPAKFTWCEEASDTALLQHGLLWGYLERLSVEETVPGFVGGEPFETPAPAQDNDA